ncbi:MAG: hypothetical protein FJ386_04730 [Verrucomicrobia bacterium]|nr:hypothetical protein [Verrucomicrobiota bacterium]
MSAPADSRELLKHFSIVFVIALAGYVLLWSLDSNLRNRRAPWEIAFEREPGGDPAIAIKPPAPGGASVRIVFTGEALAATNSPGLVRFDKPRPPLPFGTVIYDDLMYFPGAVTMDFFGHEIELLPTRLGVNRKERAWTPGEVVRLTPDQKPGPRPPDRKRPARKSP